MEVCVLTGFLFEYERAKSAKDMQTKKTNIIGVLARVGQIHTATMVLPYQTKLVHFFSEKR